MTFPARFLAKVVITDTCWLWAGCRTSRGYGCVSIAGTRRLAHRVAYEFEVGPIPVGLTIDHVRSRGCTSKLCVNPSHLEPVTAVENRRRANAQIITCKEGHPLTRAPGSRQRRCRTCEAARNRRLRLAA